MKKRLQIIMNDESWAAVESVTSQANENFKAGSISYSDVVNEMIICSEVDIKTLQLKHTDLRRSLRVLASMDDVDIDSVIRTLNEMKGKTGKRGSKSISLPESSGS